MRRFVLFAYSIILFISCEKSPKAPVFDFPDSYDTHNKTIVLQEKKVFDNDSIVHADNLFDGARLNDFDRLNDSTFQVVIRPENEPINPSPWYAFRVMSKIDQTIYLAFEYGEYKHRYYPKLSSDGITWQNADSSAIVYDEEKFDLLRLSLEEDDTVWVAGQDVLNSNFVYTWAKQFADEHSIDIEKIGLSALGRDMIVLESQVESEASSTLVILSRQHPPEVTGFKAMMYFVDELFSNDSLSADFLEDHKVLVFPLLNPDGVDLGHWRHNVNGVDLNRDWSDYRQPEIEVVANYIYEANKKSPVVMGLDFHSTYHDVFYTNDTLSIIPEVRHEWFSFMESEIEGYLVNEKSSPISRPVSKSWFYAAFRAEGITYEVGDDTEERLIELKGRLSAIALMQEFNAWK